MGNQPFELRFGFKSVQEQTVDGVVGLVPEGYASEYGVVDAVGEYHLPGSLADVVDAWGRQARPVVDYEHGFDPVLGMAPIGWGLEHRLDSHGLWVKSFIPREPTPPFQHNVGAKNARYKQVYDGIRTGRIRGYSIWGIFSHAGKALTSWSMSALTITSKPCLATATFKLGAKAMSDWDAEDPTLTEQGDAGVLSRPAFSQIMRTAQRHGDRSLHDHLLTRPVELQGAHDPEDCAICTDRRTGMGLKADEATTDPDVRAAWDAEVDRSIRLLRDFAGKRGVQHSKETQAAMRGVLNHLASAHATIAHHFGVQADVHATAGDPGQESGAA